MDRCSPTGRVRQPGRNCTASRCNTGSPNDSPSARASVDLPPPLYPMIAMRRGAPLATASAPVPPGVSCAPYAPVPCAVMSDDDTSGAGVVPYAVLMVYASGTSDSGKWGADGVAGATVP